MRSNISVGGRGNCALPAPNISPRPQASSCSWVKLDRLVKALVSSENTGAMRAAIILGAGHKYKGFLAPADAATRSPDLPLALQGAQASVAAEAPVATTYSHGRVEHGGVSRPQAAQFSNTIASAAMPSARPVNPSPSVLVALMLTWPCDKPRSAAILFTIEGICGAIFGACAMIVASILRMR